MPKYYCDYCDTFLTHDSPSVRKTHCTGRKHKDNVKFYYQKWMEEQAQHLIDATTGNNLINHLIIVVIIYLINIFFQLPAAFKAGKIASNPFAQPPPAMLNFAQPPPGMNFAQPPPQMAANFPPPGMNFPPPIRPAFN